MISANQPGDKSQFKRELKNIKLLTINTHSIIEEDYEKKLGYFVNGIINHTPDIIAMQEVNQSLGETDAAEVPGFIPCTASSVKQDNHALQVAELLKSKGLDYYWTWEPIKTGYGKYEEGLALFSRYPINSTDSIYISNSHDYHNWKTRKLLGIDTPKGRFYTVHMGWWEDEDEPFSSHWQRVDLYLKSKDKIWLMGDFNAPDDVRGEGYDEVRKSGWNDVYDLARMRDEGFTVTKKIDGWDNDKKMRIDYIWCNSDVRAKCAEVIFNGSNEPVVSDHFGVCAETE